MYKMVPNNLRLQTSRVAKLMLPWLSTNFHGNFHLCQQKFLITELIGSNNVFYTINGFLESTLWKYLIVERFVEKY